MAGESVGIKLEGKNLLEKRLPKFRRVTSELPEAARYRSFGVVYAHLLWLRDEADSLAREIYAIENQEVLPINAASQNDSSL